MRPFFRSSTVKIYLCARYGRRDELREYATEANRAGLHVVSRWLYLNEADSAGPDEQARWAERDWDEIRQCDALVFFAETDPLAPGAGRGGRNVEWGLALALRRMRILVGAPENCFHQLAYRTFATWPEALEFLRPKSEYQREGFSNEVETN
jgi:hypothetical protein